MFLIQLITKKSNVLINGIRWKSTSRIIDKILIANRGEIACRIAKTAKKLGIRTVAVYSDVDRNSLHVLMADEAFRIGPAAASQSYLKGDKLIEIAKHTNAQAIHPGYGFLSENVEFAEKCQKEDVIFIGPPATAIRDMGIKSTSKAIMTAAGVPIIQGYHGDDQTNETLKNEAKKIGFPVMIKAVRGGGGKGMRIAYSESEFEEALESARTESQKSFGDSVVLLEKFVTEPRHVEVQIFADKHGNCVHLFERDCSVQRRHQKIIEEAPAPGLSDQLRNELGLAAVRAAKAVGYVGAGTVEFILDKKTHQFHFMEMNTRLQVEHPITEMITGTDLVEWQIKIAAGDKIPLDQKEIKLNGHAFEARIYAENPRSGFLPGAGKLLYLTTPQSDNDTRIETGVKQGDEVSVHYDPMIAKLVVWGKQRNEALSKLKSKLRDYNIAGLETNINFLLDLASHPEFISGNVHTNFIENHIENLFKKIQSTNNHLYAASLATILLNKFDNKNKKNNFNPFFVESNFRVNYDHEEEIKLKYGDKDFIIKVKFNEKNLYQMSLNNDKNWIKIEGTIKNENNKFILNIIINGDLYKCNIYKNDEILAIFDERGKTEFSLIKSSFNMENDDKFSDLNSINAIAPMPGILDKLFVKSGDNVKKGDSLFVLIAMKMEYVVKATKDAKISKIPFSVGDSVPKDAIIVQFSNE